IRARPPHDASGARRRTVRTYARTRRLRRQAPRRRSVEAHREHRARAPRPGRRGRRRRMADVVPHRAVDLDPRRHRRDPAQHRRRARARAPARAARRPRQALGRDPTLTSSSAEAGGTMGDEVLLAVDGDGVARLTLNRPDAANAIDHTLSVAFAEAATALRERDDVRAVLFSGAGDRFCGGGDVKTFAASKEVDETLRDIVKQLHVAIEALAAVNAPIVAAVQGSAAGAGLALMAGADLVVAAESAKFVMAYTAIGLSPDGGSTYFLPRIIGERR